ncbi:MAG: DeoR/GlpR family DNA-binding transcription regulator [Actinobacteria bacterium]|jgi:DeoR/GlpR family transcriptional regulator of sugar metabolism|nr:DeoR/GlpR family DNA-binding transcription regulator [Actinomycetota bacterium]
MLAAQRKARILEEVGTSGARRISDLASALEVSEVTIRRDVEALASQGLVDKVHGGVTANTLSSTVEPPFAANSMKEQAAKDAMAALAAEMVRPAMAVALMGGSSVYALAKRLREVPSLTIVTNSVPISDLFAQKPRADQTVVLTGGVRTPTDSLVGNIAGEVFSRFNLDIVFMGTHGMDPEFGFSSPNLVEAETNREVIRRSAKFVVLADHSKWGVKGFSSFAGFDTADVVITSQGLGSKQLQLLRSKVKEVLVAS